MDLYSKCMQRLILPAVARVSNIKLWDEYKDMMRAEELSLDELKQIQFSKLKKIIHHAYENVPFYRERFQEMGLEPEEIKNNGNALPFPPTTKNDIMANFTKI